MKNKEKSQVQGQSDQQKNLNIPMLVKVGVAV